MRRFVLGLFATIGLVAVLAIAAVGFLVWRLAAYQPTLPAAIVLTADLGRGLVEGPGQHALADLAFGGKPTLRGFLDALERGGEDPRVKGSTPISAPIHWASPAPRRCAMRLPRSAQGKFAIAFSESFGEFGAGTRPITWPPPSTRSGCSHWARSA